MRKKFLKAIAEIPTATKDGELDAWELTVAAFGPTCAGWLVYTYRAMLHRRGAFALEVTKGTEEPPYVQIALACLMRRDGWVVRKLEHLGDVRYVIQWVGWRYWRDRNGVVSLRAIQSELEKEPS